VNLTRAAMLAMALGAPTLALAQTPTSAPSSEPPATSAPPAAMAPSAPAPTTSATPTHRSRGDNGAEQRALRVNAHITQMHSQLKITPGEEPLWEKFAQVMRDNAQQLVSAMETRRSGIATMSAPQNLQNFAQNATDAAQNLQKLSVAFNDLYNSFPDDQKKIADQVFNQDAARHKGH
jgi:periplasmic protein CpxP/Spy